MLICLVNLCQSFDIFTHFVYAFIHMFSVGIDSVFLNYCACTLHFQLFRRKLGVLWTRWLSARMNLRAIRKQQN